MCANFENFSSVRSAIGLCMWRVGRGCLADSVSVVILGGGWSGSEDGAGRKGVAREGGVRQTEQCKACSSCAEMEEADGLEALLRQSMKLGERQKRWSDSRREKGRQHKQRTNQRERGKVAVMFARAVG